VISGAGTQSLAWPIADGPYDVVVMSADGKTAPDVQVNLGIEIPHAVLAALGVLLAGLILLAVGILLILILVRRRRLTTPQPVYPAPAVPAPHVPGPSDASTERSGSASGDRRAGAEPRHRRRLIEGFGVEGDSHVGATIQHLHPMRLDPTRPNLRQVHLIQPELHDELLELASSDRTTRS